jgi:hypothetical protein
MPGGYATVIKKHFPRLRDMDHKKVKVPIIYKNQEGWWIVVLPTGSQLPAKMRFTNWYTAIGYAVEVGDYWARSHISTGSSQDVSEPGEHPNIVSRETEIKVMINK